jgi:hypothetical protein
MKKGPELLPTPGLGCLFWSMPGPDCQTGGDRLLAIE